MDKETNDILDLEFNKEKCIELSMHFGEMLRQNNCNFIETQFIITLLKEFSTFDFVHGEMDIDDDNDEKAG